MRRALNNTSAKSIAKAVLNTLGDPGPTALTGSPLGGPKLSKLRRGDSTFNLSIGVVAQSTLGAGYFCTNFCTYEKSAKFLTFTWCQKNTFPDFFGRGCYAYWRIHGLKSGARVEAPRIEMPKASTGGKGVRVPLPSRLGIWSLEERCKLNGRSAGEFCAFRCAQVVSPVVVSFKYNNVMMV